MLWDQSFVDKIDTVESVIFSLAAALGFCQVEVVTSG